MTKRREVTTSVSEFVGWTREELRAEARRSGAEQRRKQGLPPLITDPTILRLAAEALATARPTSASSPDSRGSAAALESGEHGAAGSTRSSGVLGSAPDDRPEKPMASPAAPTTERGGRRQPTSSLTTAG